MDLKSCFNFCRNGLEEYQVWKKTGWRTERCLHWIKIHHQQHRRQTVRLCSCGKPNEVIKKVCFCRMIKSDKCAHCTVEYSRKLVNEPLIIWKKSIHCIVHNRFEFIWMNVFQATITHCKSSRAYSLERNH